MQVTHPQEPFNNLPPEDVFVAVNEYGVQLGYGYVMCQYQPSVYPDRPVNIYFDMECAAEAEYLIFGALVARTRQLREQYPTVGARMYTSAGPGDMRKLAFLEHNGLTLGNSEDLVRLAIPTEPGAELFNCHVRPLPLNNQQELVNLVDRLHLNGLGHISQQHIMTLQACPVFHNCGMLYGQSLVGECIIAGRNDVAELVGIYVVPEYQRRGLARNMLQRALYLAGQSGVGEVRARIMSASQPQVRLVRHFGAELLEQTLMFPCKDL